MGNGQIAAIRAVRDAAMKLTLACAEIVGPVDMALGMAEAGTLGEAIPKSMKRQVRKIDRRKQ